MAPLRTGFYVTAPGVAAFIDCEDREAAWIQSVCDEQNAAEDYRIAELERTREILQELGAPDPDERDPMLIRIPGLRRVHNHPLLK